MEWLPLAHDKDKSQAVVNAVVNLQYEMRGISWSTEEPSASEEGLSCRELVVVWLECQQVWMNQQNQLFSSLRKPPPLPDALYRFHPVCCPVTKCTIVASNSSKKTSCQIVALGITAPFSTAIAMTATAHSMAAVRCLANSNPPLVLILSQMNALHAPVLCIYDLLYYFPYT